MITAILGGGQGSRLWPLTAHRSKPAVPVAGKFRLIDVPISNSLHAEIEQIYVLTQFNSASLHRHIAQTYRFDMFSKGFVNILAAEQNLSNTEWYQGTADAVRQNLGRLTHGNPRDILVLSGDQLYAMRMAQFVQAHRDHDADLTIAVKPVPREQASQLGIMRVDRKGRIVEFVEKPTDPVVLDRLTLDKPMIDELGLEAEPGTLLASMGIYVFRSGPLKTALLEDASKTDFGREIIPSSIGKMDVFAFLYSGYWRDIGTIPAFHEANIELTHSDPPLNLYHRDYPIYTHPRFLPGVKIRNCEVEQSVLCEGSILRGARITRSVIGIRSMVRRGTVLEDCVVMGTSFDQSTNDVDEVPFGIGRDCHIRRAIVDSGARMGDGCRLLNTSNVQVHDDPAGNYFIRGGIIVIPAQATVQPGTVI
ncbi:MAG: NTP transferase domain-containing protein [Thermoanaerobaculia bacterium]|nr:NTP transferase domain-containing protein [Thermoanaerobaculia bacterium]